MDLCAQRGAEHATKQSKRQMPDALSRQSWFHLPAMRICSASLLSTRLCTRGTAEAADAGVNFCSSSRAARRFRKMDSLAGT